MTRTTALAALFALAAPAFAQDATQGATEDAMPEDLRAAAEAYVESEAMQTALDELLSTDTFVTQIRASGVPLGPEQVTTLAGIVDEEFADVRPELEQAMTAAAADTFTAEELAALNEFYDSEEGRSVATKMQPFLQSFYREIGPTLQQTQAEIASRATEAIGPRPGQQENAPAAGQGQN